MRLLDLFCGAGGAAMGYHRAGFEIVGVDVRPQPNYPFEFHQADVLEMFRWESWWRGCDAIHASPPCQLFSRAGHLRDAQGGKSSAINLIPETREALQVSGLPYVIENVPGAPLENPVMLCGSSFGLGVQRHRLFESNQALMSLPCRHKAQGRPVGVYHVMNDHVPHGGTTAKTLEEGQAAMGIDWMTWDELKLAIPPAFTQFIGEQLLASIGAAA